MFALLYKDFLMLRKERMVWLVFGLALFAGLVAGSQPSAAVFLVFFPIYWATAYSNAYDYKYGAEAALVSLPVSRAAVVGEKYLLGMAASLIAVALAAVAGTALAAFRLAPGGFPPGFIPAALSLCAAFSAISLAAYFRFGYLKSRWVTIGLFVAPSILVGILSGSAAEEPAAGGQRSAATALAAFLGDPAALGICLLSSLALLALSFLYSTRLYKKREF